MYSTAGQTEEKDDRHHHKTVGAHKDKARREKLELKEKREKLEKSGETSQKIKPERKAASPGKRIRTDF